jgi:hypothetical protein
VALFGRKGLNQEPAPPPPPPPPPDDQKNQPGHQAVLRHLREKEQTEPWIREQLAGRIVFDFAYELLKDERGVRIENLLAMLASVGGQQCIAPIIHGARADATAEEMGLTVIKGADGRLYFFGDPPNKLLIESSHALLSLAFGAAQSLGAPVTMEMIHDEMRRVAGTVGGPDFEKLDLPPEHMVDRPTEWARVFTPKIVEALDLYDVPPMKRATAIGYALYRAVEASKDNIGPLLAARIALQCATRTAKVLLG